MIVLLFVYLSFQLQYLTEIILHFILIAKNLPLMGQRAKLWRLVKFRPQKGTIKEGLFNGTKNVWEKKVPIGR
jgi:hypothetical protein